MSSYLYWCCLPVDLVGSFCMRRIVCLIKSSCVSSILFEYKFLVCAVEKFGNLWLEFVECCCASSFANVVVLKMQLQGLVATGHFPLVLRLSQPPLKIGSPIAIIRVSNPRKFEVEVSADGGVPSFTLGVVPVTCGLPAEPSHVLPLIARHDGVMLHSITMDVCTLDEKVNTGLAAPKSKHDSICMALDRGLLSFVSKDRHYVCSSELEDERYAVIVSIVLSDGGSKELRVTGVGSKRKHDADVGREMLWSQPIFTDAEILCQGERFPVHKAIVAVGSSFFQTMFDSGMSEARDGIVIIRDANASTVRAVLQYLYLSTIPNDVDVVELFALAHRFNIQGLVRDAGSRMLSRITVDNIHARATMLRRHMQDPVVAEIWEEMIDLLTLSENRELLQNLLVEVLV